MCVYLFINVYMYIGIYVYIVGLNLVWIYLFEIEKLMKFYMVVMVENFDVLMYIWRWSLCFLGRCIEVWCYKVWNIDEVVWERLRSYLFFYCYV